MHWCSLDYFYRYTYIGYRLRAVNLSDSFLGLYINTQISKSTILIIKNKGKISTVFIYSKPYSISHHTFTPLHLHIHTHALLYIHMYTISLNHTYKQKPTWKQTSSTSFFWKKKAKKLVYLHSIKKTREHKESVRGMIIKVCSCKRIENTFI